MAATFAPPDSGDSDGAAKTKPEEVPAPTDGGIPRMTPEVLRQSCLSNRGYSAPELNEVLILHYKGFRKIEGLEAYTQLRSLFLECNGIRRLENLQAMPLLVSLYLQSNCITTIENLEALTQLQYLNLSHNGIAHVSGLADLPSLETIKLAANKIADVGGLQGLAERPSLKDVDVSCNYVEDGEAFMDFWQTALPKVECLHLHHNSCSRSVKDYRRRLVSSLPRLRWIDDRPVTAAERVGSEAWTVGGKEAELEAKRAHFQQEQDEKRRSFENFRRIQQAAAERAQAQREAQAAREAARAEAADGAVEGWVQVPAGSPNGGGREPARQEELKAKVEAFFRSSAAEAAEDSPSCQPLPKPVVAQPAVAVAATAPAEDSPSSQPLPELVVAQPAVPAEAEPVAETAPAPTPLEEEPPSFTWSSFRDRRLGQLVAENRYDFGKAAAKLGQEFGSVVSVVQCRQRYAELARPALAKSSGNGKQIKYADRGRAIDAPEPDAAAVREVSQWWLRRMGKNSSNAPLAESTAAGAAAAGEGAEKPIPTPTVERNVVEESEALVQSPVLAAPVFAPPPRRAPICPSADLFEMD